MARLAVITGGGKGIGAAIAQSLDKEGYDLVLMGRDRQALELTASTLRCAEVRETDVTREELVVEAFRGLTPHVLVNNAGAVFSAPLARTYRGDWEHMLGVNLTSAYLCAQQVLPAMKRGQWGRIVNIASTAALKGYPYVTAYCAAKHGLLGFTRALALETAKSGITVNAVCPGYTQTDLLAKSIRRITESTGRSEADAQDMLKSANPQGRFITPEEVASAVLWLCSDSAGAVTGQAIAVAGGEVT